MGQDLLAQRSITDKVSDNRLNVENALNNSGNFYSKKPDLPNFQAAFPNQVKSLLNFLNPIPLAFSDVQEKNFTFFLINPDSSLTSNQSFFLIVQQTVRFLKTHCTIKKEKPIPLKKANYSLLILNSLIS